MRVLVRVGMARGCGRRERHNYTTNLSLIKLISTNKLIRNQEEPKNTPNHCKSFGYKSKEQAMAFNNDQDTKIKCINVFIL